jgi:hypothetical protein
LRFLVVLRDESVKDKSFYHISVYSSSCISAKCRAIDILRSLSFQIQVIKRNG